MKLTNRVLNLAGILNEEDYTRNIDIDELDYDKDFETEDEETEEFEDDPDSSDFGEDDYEESEPKDKGRKVRVITSLDQYVWGVILPNKDKGVDFVDSEDQESNYMMIPTSDGKELEQGKEAFYLGRKGIRSEFAINFLKKVQETGDDVDFAHAILGLAEDLNTWGY